LSSNKIFRIFRESAAIYLSKYLLDEGANLYIYDPKVEESQIMLDLSNPELNLPIEKIKKQVTIVSDAYEASNEAHTIVICTEWDEFKVPD
jgi:UDPglucose 6-dehydrogenase